MRSPYFFCPVNIPDQNRIGNIPYFSEPVKTQVFLQRRFYQQVQN